MTAARAEEVLETLRTEAEGRMKAGVSDPRQKIAEGSPDERKTTAKLAGMFGTKAADIRLRAEWSEWSDREIARRCNVSHPVVSRLRPKSSLELSTSEAQARTYKTKHGTEATMRTCLSGAEAQIEQPRKVQRGGTVYTQNAENIGRRCNVSHNFVARMKQASLLPDSSEPHRTGCLSGCAASSCRRKTTPAYDYATSSLTPHLHTKKATRDKVA